MKTVIDDSGVQWKQVVDARIPADWYVRCGRGPYATAKKTDKPELCAAIHSLDVLVGGITETNDCYLLARWAPQGYGEIKAASLVEAIIEWECRFSREHKDDDNHR